MIYIFCAPSGSGKSTMVKHLLTMHPDLFELSVSCTTRAPRGEEVHGREYYFISVEEFQKRIENNDFINEKLYEAMITATRIYFSQLVEETQKRRLENEDTEKISNTEKESVVCKTQ